MVWDKWDDLRQIFNMACDIYKWFRSNWNDLNQIFNILGWFGSNLKHPKMVWTKSQTSWNGPDQIFNMAQDIY